MLDISAFLVAFMIVLFLVLIFVLNNIMYKPLMDFMQKRDKSIADDLSVINANDSEITELEKKANENIAKAKAEANDIKTSMINRVKDELSKKIEAKKEALEGELLSFIESLNKKREALKAELSSNAAQYKKAVEAKIKNI